MNFLSKLHRVWLLAGLLLILLPSISFAQNEDAIRKEIVDGWLKEIERIESSLDMFSSDNRALTSQQEVLQRLVANIEKYKIELTPRLTEQRSQIDKLGPVPAKDAPPEAEDIAAERARLEADFNVVDAAVKRAGVATTQANQLIGRIQELRRDVFARNLFSRQRLPFSLSAWKNLPEDISRARANLSLHFQDWQQTHSFSDGIFWLVGVVLIFYGLAKIFTTSLVNKLRGSNLHEEPLFFHQAASAVSVSFLRMGPSLIALMIIYAGLNFLEVLSPLMMHLTESLFVFIAIVVIVFSLTRTILAPKRSQWRMLPIIDRDAKKLVNLIGALALVYGFSQFAFEAVKLISAPLSIGFVLSLFSSLLFAFLLVLTLRVSLGMRETDKGIVPAHPFWPMWIKLPLWGVVIAIFIAVPMGYLSLAQFLCGQVVLTGSIVISAVLIHSAILEIRSDITEPETAIGSWMRTQLNMAKNARKQVAILVGLFLNTVLALFAIPLILLNWGFSTTDLTNLFTTLFYGFEIGSIRFSVASILIAIGLFTCGILLTRFIQRWLNQGILSTSRMQSGLSNSIETGVGYLGFLLSCLLAISYIGLDFTNLAIVAGALSVGIGFGLQSIVNNFVSGLILLVERPIKVGDWVIVGEHQGYVRRISVRSTEIETFDRSSVIVPNSELITGIVTNWTHGNSVGRAIVKIGVGYNSDPKQVYDLLIEIGKAHPKCLTYPQLKVVFEDFGASSLDFSLRVYIGNINEIFDVTTDLRMEILRVFREKNIEIAFPQLDLHIKRG